jgi:hypothetical protein
MKESENMEDWSSVLKTQSAGMLNYGDGVQDEGDGVYGTWDWKEIGMLGRVRRGCSHHWKKRR